MYVIIIIVNPITIITNGIKTGENAQNHVMSITFDNLSNINMQVIGTKGIDNFDLCFIFACFINLIVKNPLRQ
jgi:hypothetical protein